MDLGDPQTWSWIWLVAAVVFAIGEIAVAGSFFLAPFAVGALLASILGFFGADLPVQWAAFVVISAILLAAMRPLARRLDRQPPTPGVGSSRQVGQRARVVESIDGPHDHGMVLVGAERWRAESADGRPIPAGTPVVVTDVVGTRVVVAVDAVPPAPTV